MPAWLIPIILSLAKFGLPFVLRWLKKRFPWIPVEDILPILSDYDADKKMAHVSKKMARRRATSRLKNIPVKENLRV